MIKRITFLGAAETVTGSRYLIETDSSRVLVDCGLFQGKKKLRERNWAKLPFDESQLDAVVLTHAHIDHTGYLPRLCRNGFSGRVYCTHGTADLLKILLPDAAFLQEEDARRANKHRYTRHSPAIPLFTSIDAEKALERITARSFHETFEVAPKISARYSRAGHIIGSACLTMSLEETTITFTGDIGRPVDPIMEPPEPLGPTDILVTESTYGDRLHPNEAVIDALERIVTSTAAKGGAVLVPSFAVGRAQHLLHILAQLKKADRIPGLPIFLDSPMAISATGIFCDNKADHRLSDDECHLMCEAAKYTRSSDDSKAIGHRIGPMIIIAGSGMATGGRILHHFHNFLPDSKNTVLFVGYQAFGTRGRALVDGVRELKLHGRMIPVRASVERVEGLSAHADYSEMLQWFASGDLSPRRVFVTHGESSAAEAFRGRLQEKFGWDAIIPKDGSEWELETLQ